MNDRLGNPNESKLRSPKAINYMEEMSAEEIGEPPDAPPGMRLRKILVPFAYSSASALLVERLIPLAQNTGAALHILHVADPFSPRAIAEADDSSMFENRSLESSREILSDWTGSIVRGRAPAHASVRAGGRAEQIVSHAKLLGADLIVMTAHRHGRFVGARPPSIAEQVTRFAHCPVLALPESHVLSAGSCYDGFPHSGWKRVLLPVDFSSCASEALAYAAALTSMNRAKLVLLNIILAASHARGGPQRNTQCDIDQLERVAERRLKTWVDGNLPGSLQFESAVWVGISSLCAVQLEARLSNIDLILMPVRTGGGANRVPPGGFRDNLLRNARCPVLSLCQRRGKRSDQLLFSGCPL